MGRVFRGYPVQFALAGALVCLPAPALAAPSVGTVRDSVQVDASETADTTLRCPRGAMAAAAHTTSASGGALVRESVPRRLNSWSFTVAGNGAAGTAELALRCLRVRSPRGVTRVRTGVFTARRSVTVAGRGSRRTRVTCKRGYVPTGYGLDRSDAGGAARRLLLASAVPGARSWVFRLENTGTARLMGTVRVRCVTARATGRRGGAAVSERFAMSRPGFSDLASRNSTFTHRCARGSAVLAAGFSVAARDDATIGLAYPAGSRTGRWEASNPAGGPQRVRTYLTCLSLRTSFR